MSDHPNSTCNSISSLMDSSSIVVPRTPKTANDKEEAKSEAEMMLQHHSVQVRTLKNHKNPEEKASEEWNEMK